MKFYLVLIIISALTVTSCVFIPQDDHTLFVEVVGEGETTPGGKHKYTPNTLVELKATTADGWAFSHWLGEVAQRENPKTTVILDKSKKIRAVFVSIQPEIHPAPVGLITARPQRKANIAYIMIHATSDAAANPHEPYNVERIHSIFQNYGVEAHYVIDRDGSIYQFVEDHLQARHAGLGLWVNDPKLTNNMNRYSLGIEVLGIGTLDEMAGVISPEANRRIDPQMRGYTDNQYAALQSLLYQLRGKYKIPKANILGHEDYDPARKWDPGKLFEWDRIR